MAEPVSLDLSIVPDDHCPYEIKQWETIITTFDTTLGGNGGKVFTIAPGTDDDSRIGRKINIRQIRARGCIKSRELYSSTVGVGDEIPSDVVRVLLVLDQQPNQSANIFLTDIFTNPSSVWTDYNHHNSDRFIILDDQWFTVSPRSASPLSISLGTGFFVPECKLYTSCLDTDIDVTYGISPFNPATNDIYWIMLNFSQSTSAELRFSTYYTDV